MKKLFVVYILAIALFFASVCTEDGNLTLSWSLFMLSLAAHFFGVVSTYRSFFSARRLLYSIHRDVIGGYISCLLIFGICSLSMYVVYLVALSSADEVVIAFLRKVYHVCVILYIILGLAHLFGYFVPRKQMHTRATA